MRDDAPRAYGRFTVLVVAVWGERPPGEAIICPNKVYKVPWPPSWSPQQGGHSSGVMVPNPPKGNPHGKRTSTRGMSAGNKEAPDNN